MNCLATYASAHLPPAERCVWLMRMAPRTHTARTIAAALIVAPLVIGPLAAALPAAALPAQDPATTVKALVANQFAPPTLTVPVGATVTWSNEGGFHTVQGGDGVDDPASPIGINQLADVGASITKTFDKEGSYPYYCAPHISLGMKGVIVVTAAGAAAGGASPSAAPSPGPSASGSAAPGSAAPAGAPGAAGGAGPAGAPAGEASAGTASVAPTAAGPASLAPLDENLGAQSRALLEERINAEDKPLQAFRVGLAAASLALLLLAAGIYYITKSRRDEA